MIQTDYFFCYFTTVTRCMYDNVKGACARMSGCTTGGGAGVVKMFVIQCASAILNHC